MKKILVCLTLLVLLFLAGCSSAVYEVKFLVDGDVVSTQQVKKGDDAVAPSDPIKGSPVDLPAPPRSSPVD